MANQGLGILSQAVGQATSTVLQIARQEDIAAQKQKVVDTTNNIIDGALKLNDKMVAAGKTPFVVQRDIFRHITKQEADAGLPTGTAMASYKQFFGSSTGVAEGGTAMSGAEIKKNWIPQTFDGVGIRYTNPVDQSQTVMIKERQEDVDAQEVADIQKSKQKFFLDSLIQRGILLNYTPEQITAFTTNPSEAPAEVKRVLRDAERSDTLESEVDFLTMTKDKNSLTVAKSMRDNDVPGMIYNASQDIISTIMSNKDYTLQEAKSAYTDMVRKYKSLDTKAFTDVVGDLEEQFLGLIVQSHADTKFKYNTDKFKSKADYLSYELSIMENLYKRAAYGKNSALIGTKVATDMVKGLNPKVLTLFGTGTSVDKVVSQSVDVLYSLGEVEYKKTLERYGVATKSAVSNLPDTTEDFNSDDVSFKFMLDLVMSNSKLSNGTSTNPVDNIKLTRALNVITGNAAYTKKVSEALEQFSKTLDPTNAEDAYMIGVIMQFQNGLQGK